MKKVTIIAAVFCSMFHTQAAEINEQTPHKTHIEVTVNTDDSTKKVMLVRNELLQEGFSNELMNNVFGDENFYFPTSKEKYSNLLYVLQLLIDNKQFDESDKVALVSLAEKAYQMFIQHEANTM